MDNVQSHPELGEALYGGEKMQVVSRIKADVIQLEGGGNGSISREARFEAHPDNESLSNDAENGLTSGIYNKPTDATDLTRCGDGREPEENNGGLQVFGATPGLIKTEILAGNIDRSKSVPEIIEDEVSMRKLSGKKSGAHRADTHGNESICGCGECDGAHVALENYLANENALKPLVTGLWGALGFTNRFGEFDEQSYSNVASNAKQLVDSRALTSGSSHVEAIEKVEEIGSVEQLKGSHKEVFWVINTVKGTKFNQSDFNKMFDNFEEDGKGIQAFWEDQWAIEDELELRHQSDIVALKNALIADLVRRVATGANLTAADLKVIILKED